jgi:tetratricopeptide (TPR) repeat protein
LIVYPSSLGFFNRLEKLEKRPDRIRSDKMLIVEGKMNTRAAPREYAAAFKAQGLDLVDGDPAALVQRVQQSPLRDSLLAALDDWLVEEADAALRRRLCQLTAQITGHAWRQDLAALWNDAEGLAEQLEAAPPAEMTVALLVGLCQRIEHLGGDGVVVLEHAKLRHPGDFWVWFDAGVAYRHRGKAYARQAAAAYGGALAIRQDSVAAWNNLGLALKDSNDLAGAIAAGKEAVRLQPQYAPVHYNLGLALHANNDLKGALAAYQEAIRLNPQFAPAHCDLGVALKDSNDLAGAIAAYKEAIRLDPKYALARHNLGVALAASHDLAGALAAYKEAIRLDPKDAAAHHGLGLALQASNDLGGALAAFKEAIRLDPSVSSGWATLH